MIWGSREAKDLEGWMQPGAAEVENGQAWTCGLRPSLPRPHASVHCTPLLLHRALPIVLCQ